MVANAALDNMPLVESTIGSLSLARAIASPNIPQLYLVGGSSFFLRQQATRRPELSGLSSVIAVSLGSQASSSRIMIGK